LIPLLRLPVVAQQVETSLEKKKEKVDNNGLQPFSTPIGPGYVWRAPEIKR
jgi:hypothetical protein